VPLSVAVALWPEAKEKVKSKKAKRKRERRAKGRRLIMISFLQVMLRIFYLSFFISHLGDHSPATAAGTDLNSLLSFLSHWERVRERGVTTTPKPSPLIPLPRGR
jgi:hypothetical protein